MLDWLPKKKKKDHLHADLRFFAEFSQNFKIQQFNKEFFHYIKKDY